MFNEYSDKYIVSMQGYDMDDPTIDDDDRITGEDGNITIGYELDVKGWPSRYSFIPDAGISLGNKFFTFNEGKIYMHNSNAVPRNNFYDEQFNSTVEIIFNDNPSTVKEFLTLGYEGTEGWTVSKIDTESEDTFIETNNFPFISKEGKWFKPIVSTEDVYGITGHDGTDYTTEVIGTREKSGIKGFYNVVELTNDSTEKAELFAINTENFLSSN